MNPGYALLVNLLFDRALVDKEISQVVEKRIIDAVHESLKKLDPRRSDIMIRRFGLGKKKEKLREVGIVYGVTGNRIRELESDAFLTLRRNSAGFPIRVCLFEEGFLDESSHIFDPRHISKVLEKVKAGGKVTDEDLERIPIDQIDFSRRTRNSLRNDNIDSMLDLKNLSERSAMRIPNFGRKSLIEIVEALEQFGCTLKPPAY